MLGLSDLAILAFKGVINLKPQKLQALLKIC